VADLEVGVAHEVDEVGVGLVVGLLEPALLGGAVEGLPAGPVAGRPLLAGAGPAMDLLGDGLPGVADDAHLGGDGEERL
jgi:hypothetical protein